MVKLVNCSAAIIITKAVNASLKLQSRETAAVKPNCTLHSSSSLRCSVLVIKVCVSIKLFRAVTLTALCYSPE